MARPDAASSVPDLPGLPLFDDGPAVPDMPGGLSTRTVPPTTRADANPYGRRRRERPPGLRGLAGPAAATAVVTPPETRTSPVSGSVDPAPPTGPGSPNDRQVGDEAVNWDLVRDLREQASTRLAARLRSVGQLDADDRRALGRAVVEELLTERDRTSTFDGRRVSSPQHRRALAKALDDALFGLGRLQPLVDDPSIENIEITGFDQVIVERAGGELQRVDAVADSDAELVDYLQFLASRSSDGNDRPFSSVHPRLHLNLPGSRARLAAIGWVTPRPVVRIRLHRLTDVTLDDLVDLGTIDARLAAFLTAAVRARTSIVVSGDMGAGKTTMLRALARTIDPGEAIATLETEYELFLHEMPGFERVIALEGRPGSGERGPDGRGVGELTVEDLFLDVLRLNVSRIIVGEVRGPEAAAMFSAMQAGAGSLSTVHAKNAADTIERLTLAVHSNGGTESYADRLVAQQIDYVVHLSSVWDRETGRRRRVVDEVMEVGRGEGGRPATTMVFGPGAGRDRRAVPLLPPSGLAALEAAGFDASLLDDTWAGQLDDTRAGRLDRGRRDTR